MVRSLNGDTEHMLHLMERGTGEGSMATWKLNKTQWESLLRIFHPRDCHHLGEVKRHSIDSCVSVKFRLYETFFLFLLRNYFYETFYVRHEVEIAMARCGPKVTSCLWLYDAYSVQPFMMPLMETEEAVSTLPSLIVSPSAVSESFLGDSAACCKWRNDIPRDDRKLFLRPIPSRRIKSQSIAACGRQRQELGDLMSSIVITNFIKFFASHPLRWRRH